MTNDALHDAHDQDIANALSLTLSKDGMTIPTADLPMGGFRHSNTTAWENGVPQSRASYAGVFYLQAAGVPRGLDFSSLGTEIRLRLLMPTLLPDGFLFTVSVNQNNTAGVFTIRLLESDGVTVYFSEKLYLNGSTDIILPANSLVTTAKHWISWSTINNCFYLLDPAS